MKNTNTSELSPRPVAAVGALATATLALALAPAVSALAAAPVADVATLPVSLPGMTVSLESSSCAATLGEDASGDCVEALQKLLNRYGAAVAVDGGFGAATATAVKAFQTQAGLGVDGEAGPLTKAALYGGAVLPLDLRSSTCPATLAAGADGACVQTLQGVLNLYGAGLSVDGRFGSSTQAAVEDFQSGAGLDVDGRVGPATKDALYGSGVAAPVGLLGPSCPATLVEGAAGVCVSVLQELLDYYGAGLSVDGSFGALTTTAVKDFQTKVGIGADGQVGAVTKNALYDSVGAAFAGPPPGSGAGCSVTDDCDPQRFADAILTYPDIGAPVTAANEHALRM